MNLKQAMKRIEELERKVRELEARPIQQNHYHYHQPQQQLGWPQGPWWTGQPTWGPVNVPSVWASGNVGAQQTVTTAGSGEAMWIMGGNGNTYGPDH